MRDRLNKERRSWKTSRIGGKDAALEKRVPARQHPGFALL
jgi:hypothetical protein